MQSASVRIGVAGWDYPDWAGVVYPSGARRGFDRLLFLARFVDAIEINSSFYRPVSPRVAAGWLRRACERPAFRFTAKAHRGWSHEIETDPHPSVVTTLAGLQPLLDAGRLGALLVQFPQSFHRTRAAMDRIERIADLARGWPLVVELRHVSWADDRVPDWLHGLGVGWCAVDQPRVGGSTLGTIARVTSRVGYLRMHGRNAKDWFRTGAGRDARYDYLYEGAEMEEIAATTRAMAGSTAELYVVQNNHFRGKALVNALQLRALLEAAAPQAPAHLVDSYPRLRSIVRSVSDRLF